MVHCSRTRRGCFEHYPEGGGLEVYEFIWLKPNEASAQWTELGLTEDDF